MRQLELERQHGRFGSATDALTARGSGSILVPYDGRLLINYDITNTWALKSHDTK